jgi:cytoskeleton protein RodZ
MSDSNQQQAPQDETQTEVAEKTMTELPGRRLREQRENSHLSQEEAAHHLRLDVQLIKALENDDYSRLPSPAYICGYLRSYARLLKLPEDEIVRAYSHGEQIDAALIPESVSISPKKPVNTAIIKTVVIIIITALVAGGLYLAADKFDFFGPSRTQKSSQLSVPVVPKALEQPSKETVATTETNTQTQEQARESNQQQLPPAVNTVPGKTVVEELPTPKTTILDTSTPTETPQAGVTAGPATQATTAGTPAQKRAPAVKTAQLHLHFNGDSWAEVTDNTGKRLLYHLVTKDTDLNLKGEPPFTILLGNAPEVQVFYDGKEFDHTRYHRDEIAYFHVGTK